MLWTTTTTDSSLLRQPRAGGGPGRAGSRPGSAFRQTAALASTRSSGSACRSPRGTRRPRTRQRGSRVVVDDHEAARGDEADRRPRGAGPDLAGVASVDAKERDWPRCRHRAGTGKRSPGRKVTPSRSPKRAKARRVVLRSPAGLERRLPPPIGTPKGIGHPHRRSAPRRLQEAAQEDGGARAAGVAVDQIARDRSALISTAQRFEMIEPGRPMSARAKGGSRGRADGELAGVESLLAPAEGDVHVDRAGSASWRSSGSAPVLAHWKEMLDAELVLEICPSRDASRKRRR